MDKRKAIFLLLRYLAIFIYSLWGLGYKWSPKGKKYLLTIYIPKEGCKTLQRKDLRNGERVKT